MNWVLLAFLGTTGAIILICCLVALFVRHRVNRHHRVDPKVPTAAPITWLADPRAAARLHRRLAKVGRTAGEIADDHRIPAKKLRRAPEQPPLVGIAEALRQQAVDLDRAVARSGHLPTAVRRNQLIELTASVAATEDACVRLLHVSTEVRTPPVLITEAGDITDVGAQVERLAEAHRILQQIDERSGLVAAPTAPSTGVEATSAR